MANRIERRDFLKGAAVAAGMAALGGATLRSGEVHSAEEKPAGTTPPKLAANRKRPYLFGAGMIWARWLNREWEYDIKQMQAFKDMGGVITSASFDWVTVEPEKGKWDWAYSDHTVEAAQKIELVQFAYIGNTAAWALPEGVSKEHTYRNPPDEKYTEDFKNYCRTVARRYKGKINMFQFWNEPNGCSWVKDGCANGDQYAEYTKWLKIAYKALKEGNPDCIVAGAALDYHSGVTKGYEYIEGMYRSGAKGHFDAISIHPYSPNSSLHWKAVEDTHRVMKENGDGDKEVWITEYGWHNSQSDDAVKWLKEVLARLQTPDFSYVTNANYLCITDLPLDGEQYGLISRDLKMRPIAEAFKEMSLAYNK